MSTKIYNAYRVKEGIYLWDLVKDWQKLGRERAIAAISDMHIKLMEAVDENSDEYKGRVVSLQADPYYMNEEVAKKAAFNEMAANTMREEAKKNSTSFLRNYFDFDVSITFREYGGRYYVQCYCDMTMHKVLDFVEEDPRVEDYHYQNLTDKPKEISEEAWEEREKTWDKIYDREDGRFIFLSLNIMNLRDSLLVIREVEVEHYHMIKKGELLAVAPKRTEKVW